MKSQERIAVVFCTEQGVLESQAQLLVESADRFGGENVDFYSFSPRENFWPSKKTIASLKAKGVGVLLNNHNTKFEGYPIANKLLACKFVEKKLGKNRSILFVDTDTVLLNSLKTDQSRNNGALYLRPVDNKGPGSEGVEDSNDIFWQKVFALCGVDLPEPSVWTTVRPHLIRNYFNAGFIWAHKLDGFFQQWYEDFIKIVESDLRPFGWTSRDGDDFRCLDQVALAVTATRYQEYLQVLPETYNYPIPFRPMMKDRKNHSDFKDLVHVHYHKWFQHPGFLDHVTTEEDKKSAQYKWLKSQLPLQPVIDDEFKC